MTPPGHQLRMIREDLSLTIRDVETASCRIAARRRNPEYAISLSRLSDIESKSVLPSIYRLYSLAVIYRRDLRDLLGLYGIDVNDAAADLDAAPHPGSRRLEALNAVTAVRLPVRIDPGFDPRRTFNLGRIVEQWGMVPLSFLAQFSRDEYTYAYVGTEDFTMYPLLLPGTFVQIDESRTAVARGGWRSEYERPIYFLETRTDFICSWCTLEDGNIIIQPHPLSPASVRILRHPQDAEVIGQVVGIAMRISDWRAGGLEPGMKAPRALH